MRKPWLIKTVFAAAVICTVLSAIVVIAEFMLYKISYINDIRLVVPIAFCPFLFWGLHYSLTHDSMGCEIKPSAKPVYKKTSQEYNPPKGRFVFSENTINEKLGRIAERFKLKMSCKIERNQFGSLSYFVAFLDGNSSFKLRIHNTGISILAYSLISCELINGKNYNCYYYFELVDDSLSSFKSQMSTDYEYTYESNEFSSDIFFDNLSDDEIFDIVEKIIEALYGARSMKYETIETDDGKERFIFYLDAPYYYGYSETTEIGNFKFILNNENGGN